MQTVRKSGVAPEAIAALAKEVHALPKLELRGLMCILRAGSSLEQQRRSFFAMRKLRDEMKRQIGLPDSFAELSMGMSADWPQAVAEGATMLRIGTAIFGERKG